MATFFPVSNPPSHPLTFFPPPPSLRTPPFPIFPPLRFAAGNDSRRRRMRTTTVTTRAGPSTSSYVFAIALPLSLLAVTVFTSIRIAEKLDQDFLEEMATNEAFMEVDEDDGEDDDEDVESLQEEPALPRARNRPKRQA